jgi:Protein of unknown function (DUF998)
MTHKTTTSGAGAPSAAQTTSGTRMLLACGAVAAPLWGLVALAQILTRDGFDLRRQQASLLSNGDLGWIQVTNFIVAGLLFLAGAIGIRRTVRPGPGATWGPRLIAVFAVGMIAAGVLVADPANGFPPGTPAGPPQDPSWHGIGHFTAASLGLLALIVACLLFARGFAASGRPGWAAYSLATAVVVLAAVAFQAAAPDQAAANVSFFVVVAALAHGWVSLLAGWLLTVTRPSRAR